MDIILIYWGLMSVVGAVLAAYDKMASKKFTHSRVPEKTLMGVAFLGGAEAMLAVMLIIRHKTRHKKFMIGLPAFIVLHIILLAVYLFYMR